jgi:nucleolin
MKKKRPAAAQEAAEPSQPEKKQKKKKKPKADDGGEAAPATTSAAASTSASAAAEARSTDEHLIYVGGLPYSYDDDGVRSCFTECGEIVNVQRMLFPDSGKFRGIALVSFASAEGAAAAIEWDGQQWEGRFLTVKPGKAKAEATAGWLPSAEPERPKEDGSTTAYVGNLSIDRVSEADLRGLFSGVSNVRLALDKQTGRPRGFAFVGARRTRAPNP